MTDSELADKLNDYGVRCQQSDKLIAAKIAFTQASQLRPDSPEIWSNLGSIEWNLYNFDVAIEHLKKSIKLNPNFALARGNLGLVYSAQSKWKEALEQLDIAVKLDPEATGPKWDRMVTKLNMGNWQEGLKEYEIRFRHKEKDYVQFPYPIWQGEDLSEKTLFVQTEQGIGDRLLFSRYFPLIKKKYPRCKILLLTDHQVYPFFWPYKLAGIIDEIIPMGVSYPKADYGIWLMSLAALFETTTTNIPDDPGLILQYFSQFKSQQKLTLTRNTPKIGLCWAGNKDHVLDHWRSIPFEQMAELLDNSNFTFFSLQAGPHAQDIQELGVSEIIFDTSDRIQKGGWSETAITMLNLDLVVTVDTAISHLAGVLQVPVWNLLYYASYWQWLRDTDKTAFYPTMRLIRQPEPGDWKTVLNTVKSDLKNFIPDNIVNIYKNDGLNENSLKQHR